MKTVLYATDYSENSAPALRLANSLVQKFGAKLIVMHVFDIPVSLASPVSVSYMKKEKKLFVEHRVKLKEFCALHLGDTSQSSDISYIVDEDGSIWNGILEKAVKFQADLIVVGTKGNSPVREFFMGSTTKALIKHASCPVLAVPASSAIKNFGTIVYATAFERADIYAIDKLVKIAKKFKSHIKVVHITTRKEYAGEEQMEWFKELLREKVAYSNLEFELIFSDAVFEELVWYVKDVGADLMVMLERKDNNLYQRYFQEDRVIKMEKSTSIPLLSYATVNL